MTEISAISIPTAADLSARASSVAHPEGEILKATFRTAATSRGTSSGIVSSQWFSRPEDQRYLSLDDLYAATRARAESCREFIIPCDALRFFADYEGKTALGVADGGGMIGEDPAAPTHWAFGQLCSLIGAPAGYLRGLPSPLAAECLAESLKSRTVPEMKFLVRDEDAGPTLLAANGRDYGRIWDFEVVDAFRRIASKVPLKVPGVLEWQTAKGGTVAYNPFVDVTKQTTTLFASDRDVFIFLVDDTRPIQIGTLPDGSPDLVFRGVIAMNSEVGSRILKVMTFLLRGVCANRCLWGVEGFTTIEIPHRKFASEKFAAAALETVATFVQSSDRPVLAGIEAARAIKVGDDRQTVSEWIAAHVPSAKTQKAVEKLHDLHQIEEDRPIETVWDVVQAMTALARRIPRTDERVDLEEEAGKLIEACA